MSEEYFRCEQNDGLLRVTFNRPERANSINISFATALRELMERCAADSSVRALILAAEGKIWCAGGDLGSFSAAGDQLPAELRKLIIEFHGALEVMVTMNAPVIAAVDGAASGAGLSLLAATDLAYATEKSRFSMAYTAAGLTPDGGSTYNLPRVIGWRRCKELMLTNRSLQAAEAVEWGLLNGCVADADALHQTVDKLALQFASGPTQAFGNTKRLLEQSIGRDLHDQLEAESRSICSIGGGRDGREGINAFLQKRRPEFTGQA